MLTKSLTENLQHVSYYTDKKTISYINLAAPLLEKINQHISRALFRNNKHLNVAHDYEIESVIVSESRLYVFALLSSETSDEQNKQPQ